MERERMGERDNSVSDDDGEISREARAARDRAVLAGKLAEASMDDAAESATSAMASLRQVAHERKEQAAEQVEHAADRLRSQARQHDGIASDTANRAADTLDDAAGYLHEHNAAEMIDDVRRFVRQRPVQAIAGAAIGGFFVARILR